MTAMDDFHVALNPVLDEQLRIYRDIRKDFAASMRARGIEFAVPRPAHQVPYDPGVQVRNGGASVCVGPLSPACEACTCDEGSRTFFFSLKCHRDCFFCFNRNQHDYKHYLAYDRDWRSEFRSLVRGGRRMTHIGLTGGEPLLRPNETVVFFEEARRFWPDAYLRLYTSGDMLDNEVLERLSSVGLDEIRVSLKVDDDDTVWDTALGRLSRMQSFGIRAMVEMPVMPGPTERMERLLDRLDSCGVYGVNLLELCYPFGDWERFASRNLKIKNPPFDVLYTYSYAGGLPVDGSEEACLALVSYAARRGLGLGVHYCSLANKHRSQIYQQDSVVPSVGPGYDFDGGDYFWKTIKVFGADTEPVALRLQSADPRGLLWRKMEGEECVAFSRRLLPLMADFEVALAESVNVLEKRAGGLALRELDLRLCGKDVYVK